MGWLNELGFSFKSSESWQEFLVWIGWTGLDTIGNPTKRIRIVLLPTTRLAPSFIALGFLMKEASVLGGVQLFRLDELNEGVEVYFRRLRPLDPGGSKSDVYSGRVNIASSAIFPFMKMVDVLEGPKWKKSFVGSKIGSDKREFSLQPLKKMKSSDIALFLEYFGYIDATGSYLARGSIVEVISSNKKEFMDDIADLTLTAEDRKANTKANCRMDKLIGCRDAHDKVTNVRSATRFEPKENNGYQHVIIQGAKAFLNTDPWVINAPLITVLINQQEFVSIDVQRRLNSLLERRCIGDEFDIGQKIPGGLEIPIGSDIMNFHLRRTSI